MKGNEFDNQLRSQLGDLQTKLVRASNVEQQILTVDQEIKDNEAALKLQRDMIKVA